MQTMWSPNRTITPPWLIGVLLVFASALVAWPWACYGFEISAPNGRHRRWMLPLVNPHTQVAGEFLTKGLCKGARYRDQSGRIGYPGLNLAFCRLVQAVEGLAQPFCDRPNSPVSFVKFCSKSGEDYDCDHPAEYRNTLFIPCTKGVYGDLFSPLFVPYRIQNSSLSLQCSSYSSQLLNASVMLQVLLTPQNTFPLLPNESVTGRNPHIMRLSIFSSVISLPPYGILQVLPNQGNTMVVRPVKQSRGRRSPFQTVNQMHAGPWARDGILGDGIAFDRTGSQKPQRRSEEIKPPALRTH
jgi:hypothetical protein